MLQNNPQLKSLIDKLWNKFWSGGIANPLTAIEQITYLLFMKRLDDMETKRERDAEFLGKEYKSKFSGEFTIPGTETKVDKQTLRWSVFKHYPSEEMLLHVQTKVFPFLKQMNGETSPFTKHMANAVFILPKASLLTESINTIEDIFKEIEKDANERGQSFQDIQGDVYEMLLSEIASAGKNGQFRTPRHIIKLMVELVEPQFGQRVADPSCGTCGYLLGVHQYLLTQLALQANGDNIITDEDGFQRATISAMLTDDLRNIMQESLYGFDFDETMVRLGSMNLIMHGIDNPHVNYKDTLSKSYNEEGFYQVILANPPFTGNLDKGDINESLQLSTTKTELLFLERIFKMLRNGGTAAVIVPQGVLFGSNKAFVQARKMIVDNAELKAVITIPSGVFKPYAGVSTAILIFTKAGETNHVWFYDMQSDGYSLDDKRTKLTSYGDLQDIVLQYKNRNINAPNDRTAKYFFIDKKEIVEHNYDLSLNKYKEEVYEEIKYDKPELILEKLSQIESEITNSMNELKSLL